MKRYLPHIVFILLVVALTASAQFAYPKLSRTPEVARPAGANLCFQTPTTTTCLAPTYELYVFDSEYTQQGTCLKIKDADGLGYTYLTVNNGLPTFTTSSCE